MPDETPRLNLRDRAPRAIGVGGGWTLVLAVLAVAAFGVAGWFHFVKQLPLTDRMVFVPLLAAIWFSARTALGFRGRR